MSILCQSHFKFEILLAWEMTKLEKEAVCSLSWQWPRGRLSAQLEITWGISVKGLNYVRG